MDALKRFFSKPVVWTVVIMLALFLIGASRAHAEPFVRVDAGAQILRNEAPALALSVVVPEIVGNADVACGLVLTGPRDRRTGVMGGRCEIIEKIGRLNVGIGAVYLNKTDELNGSHLNFSLQLRWEISPRWGISIRHFSNAGTTDPNTGRDMVLIDYSFQ